MGGLCQLCGEGQRARGCSGFDVSFFVFPSFTNGHFYLTDAARRSIANAFTKVVTSFVSDLVLPIVSLLPFLNRNMDQKFAVLSQGPNYVTEEGYNTLKQARADGALVLAYG